MKRLTIFLSCILLLGSGVLFGQHKKPLPPVNYKNIVLFWDTSLSAQDRNLVLELAFLDNFIKDKSDLKINLVKFSNTVNSEKIYKVAKGNWHDLKQDLLQTRYDGATSFKLFVDAKYKAYDAFLIFTDGYQNQTTLREDIIKPLILVSSHEKIYFQSLQLKTISNNSYFINFNKMTLAEALNEIGVELKTKVVEQLPTKIIIRNTPIKSVSGIVTSVDAPLEGVNVIIQGKNIGEVTNSQGFYTIAAKKGDELIFSYLGFRTSKVRVSETNLNIRLLTDEMLLNTVEIQGKKEVVLGEDEIGSKKRRKLGYAVQTITSDDIKPIETNVAKSVQGKFSGVSLGQESDLSTAIIRGYNTIIGNVYPLVVLDGVPLQRADSSGGSGAGKVDLSYINTDNIAKITVLKGLAATNRWGTRGKNGVIVITSKNAVLNGKSNKPIDQALVKNNVYKENLNAVNVSNSVYIAALKKTKTLTKAYDKYLKLRLKHKQSASFYFEVSDYFKQNGNTILAERILSNILENNFNNPKELKALAFKYEANNNINKAAFVYKRILRLKPKSAQSYKNMAAIYVSQQFLTKAFYLYKSMLEGPIKNVDFRGLNIPLKTEFKRLVQVNKTTLPIAGLSVDYLTKENINARLYFEWVDSDMEFDIQFVNPQKRFFSWTHSKSYDLQRINDEKTQGFTAEEFLLIDAEKGKWLVNLTNLDLNQTKDQILKVIIYKNYGKPNETKEVKVVNLKNYNKKATLVTIDI